MSDLFDLPESKSPRLQWMEKHGIRSRYCSCARWYAWSGMDDGWGDTEDEAITQLVLKLGIKLWNEEGPK